MEHKSIALELKDLDTGKRQGVIAHAVYNSIDRMGDISTKGMFTKSWSEKKDIDFLFNHDESEIVGTVLRTFEDEHKAYTEVKFGNWKLGDDVMEMAEAGVLRGASFGYVTEKKEYIDVKGRKVRKLKEVRHEETSLLTKIPAHPGAGLVSLTKSVELDGYIRELKAHLDTMENFCRNTNASDQSIKAILVEIKQAKEIISLYDTVDTQPATEPSASENENKEFADSLYLLTLKTF